MHMILLYLLGAVIAVGLLAGLVSLTWPICLYLVLAVLGWGLTYDSKRPWAKAAGALLGPTSVGLLVLAIVLFVMNVSGPNEHEDVVRTSERALLRLHEVFASAKLSWPLFVVVVLALIGISAYAPEWRPVSRFLSLKKGIGKAATATAVATTFTFFTATGVVERQQPRVRTHLQAIYERSAKRKASQIAEYLALKSLETSLSTLDSPSKQQVAVIVKAIASAPDVGADARLRLAEHMGRQQFERSGGMRAGLGQLPSPQPEASATINALPEHEPLTALSDHLAQEKRAQSFANEARNGLGKVLEEAFGLGTKEMRDLTWAYFAQLYDPNSAVFAAGARRYVDKVADEYFSKWTKPFTDRVANELGTAVTRAHSTPQPPERVRTGVHTELARLRAQELDDAVESARKATDAAQRAKAAADANDLAVAERAVGEAEEAAARAQQAAKFVESAKTVGTSGRAAEVAVEAVRAVEAAQMARDAVLAARALRGVRFITYLF